MTDPREDATPHAASPGESGDPARSPSALPSAGGASAAAPGGKRFYLLSPTGFLVSAAMLAAAFGVAHLCGLRENVGLITGVGSDQPPTTLSLLSATAYAGLYFAATLLAPILILAAGVQSIGARLLRLLTHPSRR